MKINTTTLAGTAILAALVIVFDYTLKYSYLKISFPWLPFLKFDFTGIPIVLSFLFFGIVPGIFTSAVAFFGILARSGDVLGSSMKGVAEFSTILGMAIGSRLLNKFRIAGSFAFGAITRALVMVCVVLAVIYVGLMSIPPSYIVALLIGIFNVIQGAISMVGGYIIYVAIRRRAPSLAKKAIDDRS